MRERGRRGAGLHRPKGCVGIYLEWSSANSEFSLPRLFSTCAMHRRSGIQASIKYQASAGGAEEEEDEDEEAATQLRDRKQFHAIRTYYYSLVRVGS